MWSCSCCHHKWHLLCIMQWTLRLALNRPGRPVSFTCPGCRTVHAIATLPGFHDHPMKSLRAVPQPLEFHLQRANANRITWRNVFRHLCLCFRTRAA